MNPYSDFQTSPLSGALTESVLYDVDPANDSEGAAFSGLAVLNADITAGLVFAMFGTVFALSVKPVIAVPDNEDPPRFPITPPPDTPAKSFGRPKDVKVPAPPFE